MSHIINSKPTIMIVDDLQSNRLVLHHLLDSFDVQLVEAGNGRQALELSLQAEDLSLVILDVNLGDLDGFEVATLMRQEPKTRHVPIIFVSGVMDDNTHILQGYKAGAIDYITKPIVPFILLSKVRVILELWQLRADLEHARQTAQEAAEAKDRFLSTMSHEIRTPMNGVTGVAELLSHTQLDETQQHYVQTIIKSGELLQTLLNDVLDIAKLDAGKVILEHISFDMQQLCHEVLSLLQPSRRNDNVTLQLNYPQQETCWFYGDPARIRQVLFNLIGNALKFTEQGHVSLDITINKSQSELCEVVLCVRDTGIGIPQGKLGTLFTPFTQADASTSRHYGGTGLGLAICKNLVKLMSGIVSVESEVGVGSTFSVKLPLLIVAEHAIPEQAKTPTSLPDVNLCGHVLLAEDTQINQMVAVSMLQKLGLTVSVAPNGHQAVDMWRQLNPDLILMDCAMPVMDGLQATKLIREQEVPGQHTPIVALTADATKENNIMCRQAGMDQLITKPFNMATLAQQLQKYL